MRDMNNGQGQQFKKNVIKQLLDERSQKEVILENGFKIDKVDLLNPIQRKIFLN